MPIRHRVSRLCLLVALFVTAALLPMRALAQESDTETETARVRFQEGVEEFDQGNYTAARVAFLQAYTLKKHPAVLLNLAQSELRIPGEEALAARHFAQYLREVPDSPSLVEAQKGLAEAKRKCATVTLRVDEDDAEVLLDHEPVGTTPLPDPLYLKPGTYSIKVLKGDLVKSETVVAAAGKEETLTVRLASKAPPPTGRATKAPPPPDKERKAKAPEETEPAPRPGKRQPFFPWLGQRPLGIALGALAIGSAGAAVVTASLAKSQYASATEVRDDILAKWKQDQENNQYASDTGACNKESNLGLTPGSEYAEKCQDYIDKKDGGDTLRTVTYIGIGVAGASAIGLVVYYFVDSKGRPAKQGRLQVLPVASSEYRGISLSGRF